jgi:hypothetical protein
MYGEGLARIRIFKRFFHKGQEVDPPLMKFSKGSN